jgi:bile salt-stimulated lipase
LLPVVVWLHGGSFQYESGDVYSPSKFLDHDVVFVSLNFRLGVLGFLQMVDEVDNVETTTISQGNLGLKDQSLALAWVKKNIASFGGNPNSVTLLGVNSGAVSAHLHMLSPMSEGN